MNSRFVNPQRWMRVLALALCAAPLVVAADRSHVAPEARSVAGDAILERPHDKSVRSDHSRLTEEEITRDWPETEKFLRDNCPNRLVALNYNSPAGPKLPSKRVLVNLWRNVTQFRDSSPDLYETRVRELKLEDEIFGICVDLKRGGNKKVLHEQLRGKLRSLYELGLTERQQRIELLEKAVAVQKKNLEEDQSRIDQVVEERFRTVSTEGVVGARLDGPFKHGGAKTRAAAQSQPDEESNSAP